MIFWENHGIDCGCDEERWSKTDIHTILNLNATHYFKQKSLLQHYCEANKSRKAFPKACNYNFILVCVNMLFIQIEQELDKRRSHLYVKVYEDDPMMRMKKRTSLTMTALGSEDTECVEVIVNYLENPGSGSKNHIP
ncbi:hypothetical protein DL95DRAFT_413897 [Leptodontidium sp. 2 PMI_412]|nr:hypothetical protein DL95DRAFT_413897 [Leptodontidium sp. 2 PMI_412]